MISRENLIVVLAGESLLLGELVRSHLDRRDIRVAGMPILDPDATTRRVRGERRSAHVLVIMCEPTGDAWRECARDLAREPNASVLAVTVREGYWITRRWRERHQDRLLAAGLLTLRHALEDLEDAVESIRLTPFETTFWPDGPRHPGTHARTPDGELARAVRAHRGFASLRLAAEGKGPKQIAAELDLSERQVQSHLADLRSLVGAGSDTQLGRRALELGLIGDEPEGRP